MPSPWRDDLRQSVLSSPGTPGFCVLNHTMSNARLHAVNHDPAHIDPTVGPDVDLAPLLDLDPDLAADLTPALREQVRGWLVVRMWSLPRGPWPSATHREPGLMGFLVLDGVLTRNVSLGKIAYPELLGRGDLLRPWQRETEGRLGPVDVSWQVLEPCRVAVLDRRFAGIVGRWPEIVDELLGRALNRARELDYNMAIAQLPLLELRLLALLWHLADRWGEPAEDGVCVPIRLTHSLLAAMVLGRRPSVSSTLTELSNRGLVSRTENGWVLHGEPPTELHKLSRRDVHGGNGGS
jgi:CRP/FNR family cyclic AMP-dependent transcriptional regulator